MGWGGPENRRELLPRAAAASRPSPAGAAAAPPPLPYLRRVSLGLRRLQLPPRPEEEEEEGGEPEHPQQRQRQPPRRPPHPREDGKVRRGHREAMRGSRGRLRGQRERGWRGRGSRPPASEPAMRVPGCACSAGEGRGGGTGGGGAGRRGAGAEPLAGERCTAQAAALVPGVSLPCPLCAGGDAAPGTGTPAGAGVSVWNRGRPSLCPRSLSDSGPLPREGMRGAGQRRCEFGPGRSRSPSRSPPDSRARGGHRSTTHRGGSDMMGRLI